MDACVTQSDAAGNLLFYSNSVAVFDRNHVQMPPVAQLTGMPSVSNGARLSRLPLQRAPRVPDRRTELHRAVHRPRRKCKTGCGNRTVAITPKQYELHCSEGSAPVLTADGGSGSYTFAVTSGALPAGILLSFDGRFYGVPSQSGTFPIAVTATDTNGCRGTQNYALVVNGGASSNVRKR